MAGGPGDCKEQRVRDTTHQAFVERTGHVSNWYHALDTHNRSLITDSWGDTEGRGPCRLPALCIIYNKEKRRSSDEQVKPIVPGHNAALQQIIETSFKQDM